MDPPPNCCDTPAENMDSSPFLTLIKVIVAHTVLLLAPSTGWKHKALLCQHTCEPMASFRHTLLKHRDSRGHSQDLNTFIHVAKRPNSHFWQATTFLILASPILWMLKEIVLHKFTKVTSQHQLGEDGFSTKSYKTLKDLPQSELTNFKPTPFAKSVKT